MPSTSSSKAGAKKRPASKALALKEEAAKLSAQKATSRQRVTRSKENLAPAMAAAASVASGSSRKHVTWGKGNQPPVTGAPASAASTPASTSTPQDRDSEMADIHSESLQLFYFIFTHVLLITFFLVQLAAAKHELELLKEAAAGSSNNEDSLIECPRGEIKNLQAAMGLVDDDQTYSQICVCFYLFILARIANYMYHRLMLKAGQRRRASTISLFGLIKTRRNLHAFAT
jgi:hypothetical protein